MATQESSAYRTSGLGTLLLVMIVLVSFGLFAWTVIKDMPGVPTIMIATATTTGAQAVPTSGTVIKQPQPKPDRPAVATPIPGVAQNAATAQALYDEAVRQGEGGSIVIHPADDPQPVQYVQVEADRQPAGDNVPTAEPVVEGAPVVNIQETQQCRHGQVWTESGCKNPDSSTFGSKSRP